MTSMRWVVLTSMLFLGLAAGVSAAEGTRMAATPLPFYQARDTWWETMLASREALAEQEAAAERQAEAERQADPALKAFQPLRMELSSQQEPRKIKLQIAGLKQLYLGCAGRADVFLGEPQLIGRDNKAASLPLAKARVARRRDGSFRHSEVPNGWQPIVWEQHKYAAGFTMREAEICVELDGQAEWLEGWLGVRSEKDARQAEFWIQLRSAVEPKVKAAAARKTLAARVAEAFPSSVDTRQRRLEASAGIWEADWKPGNLAEVAARYSGACAAPQKQSAEELAKGCKSVAELKAVRDLFYAQYVGPRLSLARKTLEMVERATPRPELAAELAAMEKQFAGSQGNANGESLYVRACNLRRRIVLSHPALDFPKLLINKRSGFLPEHMCDQYLGRHGKAAPGLVVLEDWKGNPRETVLLKDKLPPGATLRPDLSYDGRSVLFAFANRGAYFIYEYSFETGQVRQVTGTAADPMVGLRGRQTAVIEDIDPCYLPDGGMAFISTRSQQFGRCHGGRYVPSYTLYRGELDGTRIRPLSFNEANEWGPAVLPDGSIVYTRWDYVNRHDTRFQSLWGMHPDGTQTAHYYGNNSEAPCLIGEAQPVPGTHKTVATAAAHHGQTLGTLIVIDPRKGQDHGAPLTWITPELPAPEGGMPRDVACAAMPLADDLPAEVEKHNLPGQQYCVARAGTPWPISEELFLCTYHHGHQYAVYLVDVLGGRELIYSDNEVSCFDPIPLRPRPMPSAMPSAIAGREAEKTGVFYIQDVYQCSYPLEPGSIKRLRVNEIISQPTAAAPQRSHAANEIVKRILGTVPVEADGSAAFEAPACTPFQLQLLDENGMAVMTMRSLVYLQPGERASCIGCHEPRTMAPPVMRQPTAKVDPITPPAGPRYEGGFSFMRTVQPVLDRYCISCHGLDKVEKDINLLGSSGEQEGRGRDGRVERRNLPFSAAYESLIASGHVNVAQRNAETYPSRPKDYFAHGGTLAKMLLDGHPDKDGKKRVELDRESFQRIVDWLDVNAQFYGDYSFNRIETQPPSPEGEKLLREAVAKRFGAELAAQPYAALVNVAMPSESRVLMAPLPVAAGGWGQIAKGAYSGKSDPGWQEMLKLVEGSVTPLTYHDIAGTCGRDQGCRCSGCWVRKDIATRRPTSGGGPTSQAGLGGR